METTRDLTLTGVLDTLAQAGDDDRVTIRQILDSFGDRSLAPVLLVPALLTASPLSGIPGVPTLTGVVVGLIVVQMLMGRDTLWFPRAISERGISRERFAKALSFLRRPVNWLDRLMKPRLLWLVGSPFNQIALLICLAIAIVTPVMELLPFVITIAAVAIGLFAAGILMRDGLVMLLGYAFVGIAGYATWKVM